MMGFSQLVVTNYRPPHTPPPLGEVLRRWFAVVVTIRPSYGHNRPFPATFGSN